MNMELIIGTALVIAGLVIAGFGVRMVLHRQANIRFSLNPQESSDRTIARDRWRQHLLRVSLRGAPAVLYGICQGLFGAVLVRINAPALLDSSIRPDAGPYTKFVVYLLLGMAVAVAWQVARNVKGTFASDEVQDRIARVVDEAMSDDSDPGVERKEM